MRDKTMGEVLDDGDTVFWRAPRPGEPVQRDGIGNVLWWQTGRDGKKQWADYHALPELVSACRSAAGFIALCQKAIESRDLSLLPNEAQRLRVENDCWEAVSIARHGR